MDDLLFDCFDVERLSFSQSRKKKEDPTWKVSQVFFIIYLYLNNWEEIPSKLYNTIANGA